MKVINKTKKTVIAEVLIIPKSLLDQSLGLLKYKTPTTILLKTRFGIHTFAMRYAIDVLILDKDNKVAAINRNMKPNRIFVWNPTHKTVLELPADTIEKTKTQLGDIILL